MVCFLRSNVCCYIILERYEGHVSFAFVNYSTLSAGKWIYHVRIHKSDFCIGIQKWLAPYTGNLFTPLQYL